MSLDETAVSLEPPKKRVIRNPISNRGKHFNISLSLEIAGRRKLFICISFPLGVVAGSLVESKLSTVVIVDVARGTSSRSLCRFFLPLRTLPRILLLDRPLSFEMNVSML